MALKIFHTADWHLGQTFFGYDREGEHDAFLSWLADALAEHGADVLLVSGDVFDVANPSASAQRRFFRFLRDANRRNPGLQVVITAGNHDSAARLEAPVPLLEELNTFIVGVVRRKEDGAIDFDPLLIPLYNRAGERQALCMAVPFLRQGDYPPEEQEQGAGNREQGGDSYTNGIRRMYAQLYEYALGKRQGDEPVIAMGHLYASGAELTEDDRSERVITGGLESISADTFPEGLAYTALGHIHKAQRVGGRENVRYSGSPLPMSFSEVNYNHQVVEVVLRSTQYAVRSTKKAVRDMEERMVDIRGILIPQTVKLLRIPCTLSPVPCSLLPDEVLEQLAALPDAAVDGDASRYPFLEVRVLMAEPDPGFRHKVEEAVAGKAVRLAAIVPSYPARGEGDAIRPLSFNDLQKIDPLDMLRHAFAARYGGEGLPEGIETLFKDVMREVEA